MKRCVATSDYRRALELEPNFAEAHYNMGSALKSQGRLDEAVGCYRRALELKPDYASALNNLGNALKDQGRLNEALEVLEHRELLLNLVYVCGYQQLWYSFANEK